MLNHDTYEQCRLASNSKMKVMACTVYSTYIFRIRHQLVSLITGIFNCSCSISREMLDSSAFLCLKQVFKCNNLRSFALEKAHNWETYEPCDKGSQAKKAWNHSSRGHSIFQQLSLNSKAAANVLWMYSFTSVWVVCCLQDYMGSVRLKPVYIKQDNFAYALVFSLPFLTACPRALLFWGI